MTSDEARSSLQKVRANYKKLLSYAEKLDKQLDEAKAIGDTRKATSIHTEIEGLVQKLLRMRQELDQFIKVIENREERTRSHQQRQRVIN